MNNIKISLYSTLLASLPFVCLADEAKQSLLSSIEFGGFIDAQAVVSEESGNSTFKLHDGAIYAEMQENGTTVFFDLPFSGTGGDDGTDLTFGESKAQVYISHPITPDLGITVGQFDMIIGFEDNDSAGNFFSSTTEYVGGPFGNTHTGLMFTYDIDDVSVSTVFSNPTDSDQLNDADAEFGSVVSLSKDNFDTYLGFVSTDIDGEADRQLLVEWGLEVPLGDASFTAQAYHFDPADSSEEDGWGAFVQYFYPFSEQLVLGLRLETVSDIDGVDEANAATVGLNYAVHDSLTFKGDVTFDENKDGEIKDSTNTLRFSTVYTF